MCTRVRDTEGGDEGAGTQALAVVRNPGVARPEGATHKLLYPDRGVFIHAVIGGSLYIAVALQYTLYRSLHCFLKRIFTRIYIMSVPDYITSVFKAHLQKFITIGDADVAAILDCFNIADIEKKENLLTEGQVCRYNYFVVKGCLRKFFINEKAIEQTTEFALDTWWMTDNMAYEFQKPSAFYIQAVEKSTVLSIHYKTQEQLLQAFPMMEKYFRFVYQRAYAASQMRIKYLYGLSKEEFYHSFNNKYPEFVQRIPQYLLASFLGLTPEYLSEIRAKKRS